MILDEKNNFNSFGILLIPIIEIQFSSEVNWNIFDFLMMEFSLTTTLFLIKY